MRKLFIIIGILFVMSPSMGLAQFLNVPPSRDGNSKPFTNLREGELNRKEGWDVGLNFGTAHSLTDIGGTREHSRILFFDTQWQATGLNLGVFGRYRFNELLALNTELNFAQIGGADTLSPMTSSRFYRGYHFKNNIYELAFKGEIYIPRYFMHIPLDIYAFVGFGMVYHDPVLRNDATIQINPSSTFSKVQPIVPLGLGVHYTLPNNFRLGYNMGWRKTFTDYLDAHSTVSSTGNDSYFFSTFSLGYYFKTRTF